MEDARLTRGMYRFCRFEEGGEYEEHNELFAPVGWSVKMHLQEDEKGTEVGVDNMQVPREEVN
jgi:hypothetical protein